MLDQAWELARADRDLHLSELTEIERHRPRAASILDLLGRQRASSRTWMTSTNLQQPVRSVIVWRAGVARLASGLVAKFMP